MKLFATGRETRRAWHQREALLFSLAIGILQAPEIHQSAAPADYLDTSDLKSVLAGGVIREDVLDEIFDISDIPTPFLDMISTGSYENSYTEWTEDKLGAPSITNKVVSGSDRVSTDNDATVANRKRVGNHAQISTKEIFLTERQSAMTDVIGTNDEMGYQTAERTQELRRDVEATALTGQASVLDDNNATAGQSAGAGAWITTNKDLGATGAVPGFQTGTKLVTAQTPGTKRALTETMVSTQIENVFNLGGMTTVLMSVPGVIKRFGRFMFTAGSPIARPTAEVSGSGPGISQTAQGYIDAFKTDFGFFMTMIPNRLQQVYSATQATVFGFDPRYWELATLYGWKVDVIAKLGLSNRKMVHTDWTLRAKLERANFQIADIDPTVAVTA